MNPGRWLWGRQGWLAIALVLATLCSMAAMASSALPSGIAERLAAGAPYADARAALLGDGWLPLRDPACRENVGGAATVCGDLPETEACSGDGLCLFHFADADGRRLSVTTYGPTARWDVPGEAAALAVRRWSLSPAPVAAAGPPACPARRFADFLPAFAADPVVQRRYTAPVVQVAELFADDDGDHVRQVRIAREAYDGFHFGRDARGYHFLGADGPMDGPPVPVRITREARGVYRAHFAWGSVEGNAYRFAFRDDCWYLVADPDPPAP
jgi:hypothetical protein